jgi:CTP:molybdopterin cytidylyltransferase MocA
MTVAAIILVPDAKAALADADGEPAVRRVVHTAWAGGALPIVLVCPDAASLADSLGDLPVTFARPEPAEPHGIAWFVHGLRAATALVAEASAALLWPLRYAWVDPETVTSLVEAHGPAPQIVIRPTYRSAAGFPILVPVALGEQLAEKPKLDADAAVSALVQSGIELRTIELGDPGIVNDMSVQRAQLPAYQGPRAPQTE